MKTYFGKYNYRVPPCIVKCIEDEMVINVGFGTTPIGQGL